MNSSVMNECLEGSRVIISVDGVEHSLPKKIVCSTSSFFDRAFNGNFKEGNEQKMELKDVKKKPFYLAVQWMFTGQIVLPTACDGSAEIITELIGFLELADRLDIMGPFDSIIGTMRSKMRSNRNALLPQHIRDVAKRPRNHPARALIDIACVGPYASAVKNPDTFGFKAELEEVEGFASDLFKAFGSTLRLFKSYTSVTIVDPLTSVTVEIDSDHF